MPTNPKNKISELGLIAYFGRIFAKNKPQVVKGIGDDTAVIKISEDRYLLNTSDMLIEDRHFRRRDSLVDVGHKALACSLSDIAAMGGKPSFALVSLGLPKRFRFKDIRLLFGGIRKAARRFSVDIIGGDTNACDKLVIDISMIGFVSPRNLVLRSNAKAGDYIFVTGGLGGSIYKKHLKFLPRVKEAQFLVDRFSLHSMIDISDGLILDLYRILEASGVGAVIFENLIPFYKDARSLKEALYMGEDFELLFTASQKDGDILLKKIQQKKIGFPLSFIGKIIKEKFQIFMVDKNRKLKKLKPKGFLHF